MHVCLLCMYVYTFMYTYVDLLVRKFLFYQIISSFLQLMQNINTNGILHSPSLSLYSKYFSEERGISQVEISMRIPLFYSKNLMNLNFWLG